MLTLKIDTEFAFYLWMQEQTFGAISCFTAKDAVVFSPFLLAPLDHCQSVLLFVGSWVKQLREVQSVWIGPMLLDRCGQTDDDSQIASQPSVRQNESYYYYYYVGMVMLVEQSGPLWLENDFVEYLTFEPTFLW
jgi:hypothetical protein